MRFHENSSSGSRVVRGGRTEGKAAGSRSSQFCEKCVNRCIFPRSVFVSLTILTDSAIHLHTQHLIGVPEGGILLNVR